MPSRIIELLSLPVRRAATPALLFSALLLAGCEGQVSVDLATDAPANRDIVQVNAYLSGVEFRTDGGGAKTLSFRDSEPVNLFDYLDGNALRLFTDEELPDGRYSSVRLVFDA